MIKRIQCLILAGLTTLAFNVSVWAAGDAAEGKKKSVVCAACHGVDGNSASVVWPNLAGQHQKYIVKQLLDYKKGIRSEASMRAFALGLSVQDIEDLAAYYASQPRKLGVAKKKYLQRGEQIYRGGDLNKGITACIACHGPRGLGNADAGFPVLSGQKVQYTVNQLLAYRENKRKNDINHIMRDISKRMSKQDMEAVANYISGLH